MSRVRLAASLSKGTTFQERFFFECGLERKYVSIINRERMSCVGDFALGGREEEVNFHVKTIRSPFYYCAVFYNGEGRRRKSVRFFLISQCLF